MDTNVGMSEEVTNTITLHSAEYVILMKTLIFLSQFCQIYW